MKAEKTSATQEFMDDDMLVYSEIITKPKRSRKTRKRKKEKETE